MNRWLRQSKLFLDRNASTILTCIGGAGVIATSILAVKATPKALRLLEEAKEEKGEELTKFEVVQVAAPAYIPAAVVGVSTIACIFSANALNKRQQAAITSAYALVNSSYKEYRNKVRDIYGEEADGHVVEEIAKDHYDAEDIPEDDNDGKVLFFDHFSGRYFRATKEAVQKAEYELNRDLVMQDVVSVNDFYDHLGIPRIDGGDRLGWSSGMNFECYWQTWIDFNHRMTTTDDGLEVYILEMFAEPMLGFDEY